MRWFQVIPGFETSSLIRRFQKNRSFSTLDTLPSQFDTLYSMMMTGMMTLSDIESIPAPAVATYFEAPFLVKDVNRKVSCVELD